MPHNDHGEEWDLDLEVCEEEDEGTPSYDELNM
jgi:hypothetical protein